MGKKAGKYKKKDSNNNKSSRKSKIDFDNEDDDMMNDAIDAFHEQRDMIPLNVNEDSAESDEDNEHPVYDVKVDEDEEDEDEEDEDDDLDDAQLTGLGAKIARMQKYLQATMGGVDDVIHDEAENKDNRVWGRGANIYYKTNEPDSSDADKEEEEEVERLQKDKAKTLSPADFGLDDDDLTFEEISVQGKRGEAAENKTGIAYEEVQKDLSALTKEEQMDVVYSSAPELVNLLSELNEAIEQLDSNVNPLLNKINGDNVIKGGMNYVEVKKLLLLSYCQAITFFLLLKSEGQPVRDHPVLTRLVEIKNLLDKVKELDENLPSELEDFLDKDVDDSTSAKLATENVVTEPLSISHKHSLALTDVQLTKSRKTHLMEANGLKNQGRNESKRKWLEDEVGIESREMLKMRAALEEKLKQTGVLASISQKHEKQKKRMRLLNGQLATSDDFDDDAAGGGDDRELTSSNKLFRLVTPIAARPKVISGDDDLPKRDDIGERRRKHELRVLAGAGVEPADEVEDVAPADHATYHNDAGSEDGEEDSDLEFYREVGKQRSAKIAAKQNMYSRSPAMPLTPEILVDGKRQISRQIEKNRGLTRSRKKLTKNPRKKYRGKHEKAQKSRKGQVRDIKKPSGSYGGETTGINPGISRSIRFKG